MSFIRYSWVKNIANMFASNFIEPRLSVYNDFTTVMKKIENYDSPISITDLARALNWDAFRIANAVTFALENNSLALIRCKDQTFIGFPRDIF